jgi:hypothetical protein
VNSNPLPHALKDELDVLSTPCLAYQIVPASLRGTKLSETVTKVVGGGKLALCLPLRLLVVSGWSPSRSGGGTLVGNLPRTDDVLDMLLFLFCRDWNRPLLVTGLCVLHAGRASGFIQVFSLPAPHRPGGQFETVCELGSAEPFIFRCRGHELDDKDFCDVCFTVTGPTPLLLVTDFVLGTVHMVDLTSVSHVGHVAPLGALPCARAVSASRLHIAVCVEGAAGIAVHLLDAVSRVRKCVIGGGGVPVPAGHLSAPTCIRLSVDGTHLVVANEGSGDLIMFSTTTGVYQRSVCGTEAARLTRVTEVQGEWLVGGELSLCCPTAVVVPGLGIVTTGSVNVVVISVYAFPA